MDSKDTIENQQQFTNVNYRQIKKSNKNPKRSSSSRYYKTESRKRDFKSRNSSESSAVSNLTKPESKKNKKFNKSDFLSESSYEFLNSSPPDIFSNTKTKKELINGAYFFKLKFAL